MHLVPYLIIFGLLMTIKGGGTSQACAACKYQRRKCAPDCALAPYFPADKPKMFQDAHRLYGVCNIMKILRKVKDDDKDEAMRSIIYESEIRRKFPVYGSLHVAALLQEQIAHAREELHLVRSWLAMLKSKEKGQSQSTTTNNINDINNNNLTYQPVSIPPSQFQPDLVTPGTSYNPYHHTNSDMYLASSNKFVTRDKDVMYVESNEDVKPSLSLHPQQQEVHAKHIINSNNNNYYCVNSLSNDMNQFMISSQGQQVIDHNYDDMNYDNIADDRQSYIESKDVCESSAESTLKDSIQSADTSSQNYELKNAAACFGLTSVNRFKFDG